MVCQDKYQRNFRPFVHEYFIRINTNILYVYTNIYPAFIIFMNVRPPIITIFPCPLLLNFFFCSSQRRKDINVIYHLTITAGFQLSRSDLEFKQTEAIGFFPVCTTITKEGRGGQYGWLNNSKEDEDVGNLSLCAVHFSHWIPHITLTCEKGVKLAKDYFRISIRRETNFKS